MNRVLLVLILLFIGQTGSAQQSWVIQKHIYTENGLPQNSVRDIHYKWGYLWLATEAGFARWDGSHIRALSKADDPFFFQSGRSGYIGDDAAGNLVVTAENYPPKTKYINSNAELDRRIFGQNKYLLGRQYKAISVPPGLLSDPVWKKEFRDVQLDLISIYSEDGLSGVAFADSALVWFDQQHVYRQYYPYKNAVSFLLHRVLYCITNKGELLRYQPGEKPLSITSGSLAQVMKQAVQQGAVFYSISYQGDQLMRIDNRIYKILLQHGIPEAHPVATIHFPFNEYYSVIYDSVNSRITVGTVTHGAYILQPNRFRTICYHSAEAEKSSEYGIYTLAPYSDSFLLCHYGLVPVYGDSFIRKDICCYARMALGKYKEQFLLVQNDEVLGMDKNLQSAMPFFKLHFGVMDFGPSTDTSIIVLGADTLIKYNFNTRLKTALAVKHDKYDGFRCMLQTDSNTLLIGGWISLYLYYIKENKLLQLPAFSNINFRTFYKDRKGWIWMGTFGSGFFAWNGRRIIRFPRDRMNYLQTINCFQEDKYGSMWITTNRGMFRYRMEDLHHFDPDRNNYLFYNYFDESDGLINAEFNHGSPCSQMLADGRLAFANMAGVVLFHPDSIPFRIPVSQVRIDRIFADSARLPVSGSIVVPAGADRLTFQVSVPYMGNPYELQVFYRIAGGTGKWLWLPENGELELNRPSVGNYNLEFRIISAGRDIYTHVRFSVAPFWYESRTAGIVFGLAVLALFAFVIMLILMRARKQRLRLAQLVSLRTNELRQTVAQLEITVEQLRQSEEELFRINKIKERTTSMVLHDLRSPLRFLTRLATDLYRNISGKPADNTSAEEASFALMQATRRISDFSYDYMKWLMQYDEQNAAKVSAVDVSDVLKKTVDLFTDLAAHNGNALEWNIEDGLIARTAADYFEIVIRNIVDNAVKYTKDGRIKITAAGEAGKIIIMVKDSGKGMTPSQLAMFNAEESGADDNTSLGHKIITSLVKQCGGRLKIDSVEGQGTTACLELEIFKE